MWSANSTDKHKGMKNNRCTFLRHEQQQKTGLNRFVRGANWSKTTDGTVKSLETIFFCSLSLSLSFCTATFSHGIPIINCCRQPNDGRRRIMVRVQLLHLLSMNYEQWKNGGSWLIMRSIDYCVAYIRCDDGQRTRLLIEPPCICIVFTLSCAARQHLIMIIIWLNVPSRAILLCCLRYTHNNDSMAIQRESNK